MLEVGIRESDTATQAGALFDTGNGSALPLPQFSVDSHSIGINLRDKRLFLSLKTSVVRLQLLKFSLKLYLLALPLDYQPGNVIIDTIKAFTRRFSLFHQVQHLIFKSGAPLLKVFRLRLEIAEFLGVGNFTIIQFLLNSLDFSGEVVNLPLRRLLLFAQFLDVLLFGSEFCPRLVYFLALPELVGNLSLRLRVGFERQLNFLQLV